MSPNQKSFLQNLSIAEHKAYLLSSFALSIASRAAKRKKRDGLKIQSVFMSEFKQRDRRP
jgi:hypothetical protein